jgi:hypothetical protein
LGNKLFTFLHIEQKAIEELGYRMTPENALTDCQTLQLMIVSDTSSLEKALASRQTLQIMGNDLNHHAAGRFAARRKHAGTRLPCVRVAPHSRSGEAPPIYLIIKKLLKNLVRLQPSKL